MRKKIFLLMALLSSVLFLSCGIGNNGLTTDENVITEDDGGNGNNGGDDNENNGGDDNGNNGGDDNENNGGDDNENNGGEGATGSHYQGQSCAQCHSSGEHQFKIGGTIFTDLQAPNGDVGKAAAYYKVKFITQSGGTFITNIGRGTGNFWSNANINGNYTVEVLDSSGNVVNSSMQYTHDNTRFDCNSCHTSSGQNNAPGRIVSYDYYNGGGNNTPNQPPTITSFTANPTSGTAPLDVSFTCNAVDTDGSITEYRFDFNNDGTIDTTNTSGAASYSYTASGNYTAKCIAVDNLGATSSQTVNISVTSNTPNPTTVSFSNDVYPILQTNCQGCHNAYSRRTYQVSDVPNTYSNLTTNNLIDTQNPANSLLLKKGSGSVSHDGGSVIPTNSTEYQTILNWIQQGAQNN